MIGKGNLIGQGCTAEVYDYDSDKILKLYRKSMPDIDCENEFYITKNVNLSLGISPKCYEIVKLEDRIGAIYEKIDGKTMLKEIFAKFWTIKKHAKLFAHYHFEIQKNVDFKLQTVKDKLKHDIGELKQLSKVEKEKLFEYIDSLPNGTTLCHFDFHPDNIIIKNNKPVIIDWMTACIGDGLSDIARTSVILKYSDIPVKSEFVKKILKRTVKKLYINYLKEYIKISGAQFKDIQKWEVPIAAARLYERRPEEEEKQLLKIVHQYTNCIDRGEAGNEN